MTKKKRKIIFAFIMKSFVCICYQLLHTEYLIGVEVNYFPSDFILQLNFLGGYYLFFLHVLLL